jgi:hypothetical protein
MATAAIIGAIVFFIVLALLLRGLPEAPQAETEEDLLRQGFTLKEAKKEARAQRNEHRAQRRLTNSSVRTATRVSNLVRKLSRKL